MTNPELRPAGPLDDEFLFQVYASTRAAEMALLVNWTEEQRHEFVAMQFHAQTIDYRRRFPDADYWIIVVAGRPVGRLWVDRHDSEIRILDITVLPAYQGRGIGTALLVGLQDEARQRTVPLRDSVAVDNPRAEALYRRLGFRQIGATGTYTSLEWTPDAS